MRFAIPQPPVRPFRLGKRITDWPLAFRLALLFLPAALILTFLSIFAGYRSSSKSLMESLSNVPLLEAKIQSTAMERMLKELRHALSRIAKYGTPTPEFFRENIELLFQDNHALVHEIGFKPSTGDSFLLVRDADGFAELVNGASGRSPYSPFQQTSANPPEPGNAKLYPAVYFIDPNSPLPDKAGRIPVMRMAMLLEDGSGQLVLGISLVELRARLAALITTGSPLRLPTQEGEAQLAFFFDADGWMLFEMQQAEGKDFLPDTSRQGYTGDLGRAGYDAAFRPLTTHENYWLMVTDAMEGRYGTVPALKDRYTSTHVGATGILCFAPVFFAANDSSAATPMGGIAFFETSTLPLSAFLRLANNFIVMTVAVLLVFAFLLWRVSRKFARPVKLMAKDLSSMAASGELAFINQGAVFTEQQKLQAAINSIISSTMITKSDLERISQEMHHTRSRQPVDLNQPLDPPVQETEFDLVGSSALIREVRQHVHKAARAGTDVLVWGETGTGKELVAAAIHRAGKRNSGPYISINCGALDENLLLDALFGHVKGAFSEAKTDRKGAFLSADGGTLHLDEIANASPKVQQALLRALSVRRIRPLGSDVEASFNTRVVAATNVDLRECVRAGTFREDLYYRLAIISIETPPLRHRKEDIPELAAFCIREAALSLGRPEARLSRGALDMMAAYDWPGNVREFKNCLTRAMAFVEGDLILPQHIVLEQDAYRTYSKPLAPELLAERIQQGASSVDARSLYSSASIPAPPLSEQNPIQDAYGADAGQGGGFFRGIINAASNLLPSQDKESSPVSKDKTASPFSPPFPQAPGNGKDSFTQAFPPIIFPQGFAMPASAPSYPGNGKKTHAPESPPGVPVPVPPPQAAGANAPLLPSDSSTQGDLNERQLRAMNLIRKQGEITRSQYESAAGRDISSRTAQNDLRELVERGILDRVGAGPGTRYIFRARK